MDLDSTILLPVARRGSAGTTTFEVGPHGLRASHLTLGTQCGNKQPRLRASIRLADPLGIGQSQSRNPIKVSDTRPLESETTLTRFYVRPIPQEYDAFKSATTLWKSQSVSEGSEIINLLEGFGEIRLLS